MITVGLRGERKAEAAIGTSIVFIALILVSSAAGSMIVQNVETAGEQARTTFDDSLSRVACFLDIKSAVGICDPSRGEMLGLELAVALGPGSDALNLSSLTIELLLPDAHLFLTFGEGFQAERLLTVDRSNSSTIISHGDLFLIRFFFPHGATGGSVVKIGLLPSQGFPTTDAIFVPDAITANYIDIR